MKNRERQPAKRMPPINPEPSGNPDEMREIGEDISGEQPEIGHKDEGVTNKRRKNRS